MERQDKSNTLDLYSRLIDQSPDSTIFSDAQGVIRLWNPASETIFGYSADEAVGQSLNLIIPEDLRKAHWIGFERAMKAGHTRNGGKVLTTRAVHKSGEKIYVNLSFAVILDDQGNAIGAMSQARDFTARYLEEKALKKKVAELESQLAKASK